MLFGYLGLTASIMVGLGECLVHLNLSPPQHQTCLIAFFTGIPRETMTLGNYLIVSFISLYIFGYYHLYLALQKGSEGLAKSVLVLGIFAFIIGGVWVSSRAHFGTTLQILQEAGADDLRASRLAITTMMVGPTCSSPILGRLCRFS